MIKLVYSEQQWGSNLQKSSGSRGEDFFRNRPIRNKNCLWWPCLLTDRDEMNNRYRGPSIDASYQVSDIYPCDFGGEDF